LVDLKDRALPNGVLSRRGKKNFSINSISYTGRCRYVEKKRRALPEGSARRAGAAFLLEQLHRVDERLDHAPRQRDAHP
jgi:hypothetical protein